MYFANRTLHRVVSFPCTSSLGDSADRPMMATHHDGDVIARVTTDETLLRLNLTEDLKIILSAMLSRPEDYFFDQIDGMVIAQNGLCILKVDFGDRGNDRSLFLNLADYRSERWRVLAEPTLAVLGLVGIALVAVSL